MNGALDYKIWEPYKSLLPIPKTPAIKFLT